jgi:uncharacterized protein YndB with AHSA1/START domain
MGSDWSGIAIADKIEKKVVLRAPLARVWSAVSDAREFGSWFGVSFEGAFSPGARLTGRIVPTNVDPDVAKMQEPYSGMTFDIVVEDIEPMRRLSFRWHPSPVEPGVDYSKEPMTLVSFDLREVSGGTELTVTESGFDRIPLERRAKAFTGNEEGWEIQTKLIARHLARATA